MTAENLLQHLKRAASRARRKVGLSAQLPRRTVTIGRTKTAARLPRLKDLGRDILDAIDRAEENTKLVYSLTTELMQMSLYVGEEETYSNNLTNPQNAWGPVYIEANGLRQNPESASQHEILREAVLRLGGFEWSDAAKTDKGLARHLQELLAYL